MRNLVAPPFLFCHSRHMQKLLLTLCLTLIATPLWAQSAMTGAEFDSYTRGKTFFYGNQGSAYGAEEYLDNRRVRWTFLDGRCQEGHWFTEEDMICFVYEDQPDTQCWTFYLAPGGLTARFENEPSSLELYEVEKSAEPLTCMGPDIGV